MDEKKLSFTVRLGRREVVALIALAVVAFHPGVLSTEQMTMTTYYPSPYGVYDMMRSQNNTFLAYNSGTVAIGTTAPAANTKLHVAGGGNRTQLDGQLGVGGAFVDVNGDSAMTISRANGRGNVYVQGSLNNGWLRIGDIDATYSGINYEWDGNPNTGLVLAAGSGKVFLGTNDTQYLANSCRFVGYNFGTTDYCPNGGVGWTAYNAGNGGNVGMIFSTNNPGSTIDIRTDASGMLRAWNRTAGNWAVNDIMSPIPISGQMLCCKMQQY